MWNQLKFVIVEDDAVIAQLIEMHLIEAGHTVLDIIHHGHDAIQTITKLKPDMVLLDIDLSDDDIDGITIGSQLNVDSQIPFIYLTAFSDRKTLERAKQSRPCGYVVKPYKPADLLSSITIGMFNFSARQPELTISQVNQLATDPLSEREFNIVRDITLGLTNGQIAAKQYVSLNTIKWHLQNIYSKLGAKNRTSLVALVLDIS